MSDTITKKPNTKEQIIRKAYYDPDVGFVGIDKLFYKLKTQGITRKEIAAFLKKQEVYQINKKINYKRNSFIPMFPLQEFQIDLIYLENPVLNNSRYGLCCIDAFTKKADIELLKRKDIPNVIEGMKRIFKRMGIPTMIYCDEGSEFTSSEFKRLMNSHNIDLVFALNHATLVERFNRTIKEILHKYLQSTDSKTITNVLPKMLSNYNNSFHSVIGMSPNEVTEDNEHLVQLRLMRKLYHKTLSKINVGDKVRIELKQKAFTKGYKPKYSTEIHTVLKKEKHYYTVNDSNKQYHRGNLIPVNEVEVNENEPDIEGTLEQRSRNLHKHKAHAKYVIPETNLSERGRTLRQRNPIHHLVDDKYGNVLY